VCIERTFEMPQAAAGPRVTPTNPILSSFSCACAESGPAAKAKPARAAQSATLIVGIPIFVSPPLASRIVVMFCLGHATSPSKYVHTRLSTLTSRTVYNTVCKLTRQRMQLPDFVEAKSVPDVFESA